MDWPKREMKKRFQTMVRFACKWTVLKIMSAIWFVHMHAKVFRSSRETSEELRFFLGDAHAHVGQHGV
jgi:hypothetical protein